MSAPQITLLITLTGRDRPGVTSRLFSVLAAHELSVIDVEQVVIRGRLVLGVLLSCDHAPDLTAIHRQVAAVAEQDQVHAAGIAHGLAPHDAGRAGQAALLQREELRVQLELLLKLQLVIRQHLSKQLPGAVRQFEHQLAHHADHLATQQASKLRRRAEALMRRPSRG